MQLSRSNSTSVITEIHREYLTLASRLSRSFKVIGTDTDRSAIYDFLVTFHTNHGPISYRFRDKQQFPSKITNLPTLLTGSPWNWVVVLGLKNSKTRMMGYQAEKTFDDTFSCFDTIQERDGQRDRHRPTASTALTHCIMR